MDGDEGSGPEGEKRKHEDSDLEEDLEDEDYDLLEENLGVKVQRKVSQGSSTHILETGETRG